MWHLVNLAWRQRIAWFWPLWITETAVVAIGAALAVGRAPKHESRDFARGPRRVWPPITCAALAVLVLLLTGYVADTLKWEVFANYDDAYYTLNILRGTSFPPPIWREIGRFFPLSNQEFNLVRHFTHSVAGYHALPPVELAIFACVLLALGEDLSLAVSAGLAAFVLVLPGTVISFTGMTFPERNVLFCLACLLVFVRQFEKTLLTGWAVAAAVVAQIMVYYKETAFLLLWGFAMGRLILRCRRADGAGWDFGRLRDRESRLDICLVFVGALFLLCYAAAMTPHANMAYVDQKRFSPALVLGYYLKADLLVWLLTGVAVVRAWRVARRGVEPMPLWDALAAGGIAYFVVYLALGLANSYYMAPVDLIAVLYLGRLAIESWDGMQTRSRALVAGAAIAALLQGASLSVFYQFQRKNMIHAKAELAEVIAARYRSASGDPLRLYFPFANANSLSEFAAYLTYEGVPVEEEAPGKPSATDGVRLVKDVAKDGPCVSYENFVCHAASRPEPNDLVIEMPDDQESSAEMSQYRDGGRLLWSYEPAPVPSPWFRALVTDLRTYPIHSQREGLSAGWLRASVTQWK